MKILVLNCGSSTVKYQLLEMQGEQALASGVVERIGSDSAGHRHQVAPGILKHLPAGHDSREVATLLDHAAAVRRVLAALTHPETGVIRGPGEIAGVGHRVVHGGEHFTRSVRVDDEVKRTIRELFSLAPLHNPANLMGIEAAEALLPGVPQTVVFDTAFHTTMPRLAFLYALPYAIYKKHRVRRYGFHGTSHMYVAQQVAALPGWGGLEGRRLITCHLGNGCSLCAIQDGRSVDTSMGFTPLEGLVMGTRSGDVDPGAMAYIMDREEITPAELNSMLNKHSGLRGLSGISGDFRIIEEEMVKGDPRAEEAFQIFAYRLRKYIGAYAAAMGGVDALVFTAGIGANSWRLRAEVCRDLGFLGVTCDDPANREGQGDRLISAPDAPVAVWVIHTNEELVIARDTAELLAAR